MTMATPKKLVCDRCGKELTDKDAIGVALEGAEAWQMSVIDRDGMPRGLFPCEDYRHCGGEMKEAKGKGIFGRGGKSD